MKRTILVLSVLLAITAPASAAFLGVNLRLGESFLNTGIEKVAGDVSREMPMGCGRAWLERTAECFVAPGAMAGSGLSGGSSAAATYPAKFMEGAADVGEGTPLAESVEIEIPVTFEGFAAPGPEAQAFVNQEIVGPGPEAQPFVNQEIVGPGPEAQPFVNQEFAGAGVEAPSSDLAQVTINRQTGLTFQGQVTDALGAQPAGAMTGTTLSGAPYTTIPDGILPNGGLLEVKAGQYISYGPQLQTQVGIGQQIGVPSTLVVGPNSTVSGNVLTNFGQGNVLRFNPATGTFSPY